MPLENPPQRSVGVRAEPKPIQQLMRAGLGKLWVDAPEPGDEFEILERRRPVIDHRLVGDHATMDFAPIRSVAVSMPSDRDASGIGLE